MNSHTTVWAILAQSKFLKQNSMTKEPTTHNLEININGYSVPVWTVCSKADFTRRGLTKGIEEMLGPRFLHPLLSSCRGVEAERLPTILSKGCDVEPPSAPFFAACLEKALEYGCYSDQIIQVFHPESLACSWRERPASLPTSERNEIESNYPTVIPSVDGSILWFTRFPAEDTRAATDYERAYGNWIPGDTTKALAALIFISEDSDNVERFISAIATTS